MDFTNLLLALIVAQIGVGSIRIGKSLDEIVNAINNLADEIGEDEVDE